jgi:DNA-binding CsgD family transcriptional regulator
MPEIRNLSEREIEILRLVATGASNKEIANKLNISTNTVKVHLRNIFPKIGVNSRTEAAMLAVREGIIPDINRSSEYISEESQADKENIGDLSIRKNNRRILILGSLVIFLAFVVFISVFFLIRNSIVARKSFVTTVQGESTGWQTLTKLPSPRSDFALVMSQNRLYAIGGKTVDSISNQVESLDLNNDQWENVSNKPTAVSDIQAVVINGLIYVPGGKKESGEISDQLEIYDPNNDVWMSGEPVPQPRSAYSLTAFDGMVYLFGGFDGNGYVNTVFQYDPSTDKWDIMNPMPTPRAFAGTGVAYGKIFVFGGLNDKGALSVNEIYTPSSGTDLAGTWTKGLEMPAKRYGMGIVGIADIIFIIGGVDSKNQALPSWVLYPEGDLWQVFEAPIVEPWLGLGFTGAGSYLYAIGGKSDAKILDDAYTFQAIYSALLPIIPNR